MMTLDDANRIDGHLEVTSHEFSDTAIGSILPCRSPDLHSKNILHLRHRICLGARFHTDF